MSISVKGPNTRPVSSNNLEDLKKKMTASHLHCTAGSSRSFTAIQKDTGRCCGSRLRKGEVFAYVGLPQNLKDLNNSDSRGCPPPPLPISRWQGHENREIADRFRRRVSPFPPPDTLVGLLKLFCLTSDTCLYLTVLTATDNSRI